MLQKQFTSPTKRFILYALSILIVFVCIFWRFADELAEKELHNFDITIIDWVQSFISDKLTRIMEAFTYLGSPRVVIVISVLTIILMLFNKKWWETLLFVGCIRFFSF